MRRSLLYFLFLLLAGHYTMAQLSTTTQNNTSCSFPNGFASALFNGTTEGYTFDWFEGADDTGPVLFSGPAVINLSAGTYTIRAFDQLAGTVVGTAQIIISNNITIPVVATESTPNTSCSVFRNGSLTAIVAGSPTDYDYVWVSAEGLLLSNSQTITQQPSGIYSVTVTDLISGCRAITSAIIEDNFLFPEASIHSVPNTSCTAPGNGSLTPVEIIEAGVTSPLVNYSFEWYEGANTDGAVISFEPVIDQLFAGTYTVKVTNNITGCQGLTTAEVAHAPVIPEVSIQSTPNTSCSVFRNGSLSAAVTGSPTDYDYLWVNAEGFVLANTQTITQQPSGIYNVTVTELISGCQTTVTAEIVDALIFPSVSLQSAPNTSCAFPRNGSLTPVEIIEAGVSSPLANYSFEWYEGLNADGFLLSNNQTIDQQGSGIYTVKVTNFFTGCQGTATATIVDAQVPPVVNIQVTSNTDCTAPNGSLTAITEGPFFQYNFAWYEGTSVTPDPSLSTDQTLNDLAAGTYTVLVTDANTSCTTIVSAQVIDDCQFSAAFFSMIAGDVITNPKKLETTTVSYYPNPVSELLFIRSEITSSVALVNQRGEVVLRQKLGASPDSFALDLSGTSPGRYILLVTQGTKTTSHQIIVKK